MSTLVTSTDPEKEYEFDEGYPEYRTTLLKKEHTTKKGVHYPALFQTVRVLVEPYHLIPDGNKQKKRFQEAAIKEAKSDILNRKLRRILQSHKFRTKFNERNRT